MIRRISAGLVAASLFAFPATAHHDGEIAKVGDLRISHGWTQATGHMAHAMNVYLTIKNTGDDAARLVDAEVPFAKDGVFQANVVDADGALETRNLDSVVIKPGQRITFQPGGTHIVFNDVGRHFNVGEQFHTKLTFAEAGSVKLDVLVERGADHEHEDVS